MPFYKNIKPQKILGDYGITKIGKVEFYFIRNGRLFFPGTVCTADRRAIIPIIWKDFLFTASRFLSFTEN